MVFGITLESGLPAEGTLRRLVVKTTLSYRRNIVS